jgi:hypothetical protein
VGENEWNSRLAEELKRLGFPLAQFEPIVKTLSGGRSIVRKPDVGIKNGGYHFVSGKLGERQELEAYRSADEYKTTFDGLKDLGDVFAVTYPAGKGERFHIHVLPRVGRETAVSFTVESLESVAVRIADTINGRIAELDQFADPLASVAPRFLRNAALELAQGIKGVKDEDLEEVFGGKAFFGPSFKDLFLEPRREKRCDWELRFSLRIRCSFTSYCPEPLHEQEPLKSSFNHSRTRQKPRGPLDILLLKSA